MVPREQDDLINLVQGFRFMKQNNLDTGFNREEKLELVKKMKVVQVKAGQRIFKDDEVEID